MMSPYIFSSLSAFALLLCQPLDAQEAGAPTVGNAAEVQGSLFEKSRVAPGTRSGPEALAADYQFEQGIHYYEEGEFEKALDYFKRVVELQPSDAAAHFNLGILYGEMRQFPAALHEFNKSLELNPHNAAAQFNRGVIFMKQRRYEDAITAFEKARLFGGRSAPVDYNLAVCYEYAGGKRYGKGFDREKSIFHYKEALKEEPDNAVIHFNLGMVYINSNEFELAEYELRKATEIDPDMGEGFLQIGILLLKKANYHAALESLRRARRLDAALPVEAPLVEAYSGLGQFLLENGDYEGARRNFVEVLRLDPSHVQAMVSLARAYRGLGDFAMTVDYFSKALFVDDTLPLKRELAEAYALWGNELAHEGFYDLAAKQYENAVLLEPDNPRHYEELGKLFHFELGNRGRAIHYYRKSLALGLPMSESDAVRKLLADAVREESHLVDKYRELVEENPENAKLHYNLAVFYQETGRLDGAIDEYKEALRLGPGNCFAHYNLALVYREKGQRSAAVRHLQSALRHCPGYARAAYALGGVYEELGEYGKARISYNEALTNEPEFADAHLALALLLRRRFGDVEGSKKHFQHYRRLQEKK
jgi:tetratricopeptide (TPR) repeat protein